jgi:hypothetical protein
MRRPQLGARSSAKISTRSTAGGETSAQAREFSPGSANPASGLRSEFGEDDGEIGNGVRT